MAEDPLLHRKILFSDEAHFWLNGYVNRQNCRFWNEDQPEALLKLPMHPIKVTVECSLWAGGIIGTYSFKDVANRNVTVNGERYREMISNLFSNKTHELELHHIWFQQDTALVKLVEDPLLYRIIVFSDEAYFWPNGYVKSP